MGDVVAKLVRNDLPRLREILKGFFSANKFNADECRIVLENKAHIANFQGEYFWSDEGQGLRYATNLCKFMMAPHNWM